jgi:NitT/TauT family transport system substrate-binding protein
VRTTTISKIRYAILLLVIVATTNSCSHRELIPMQLLLSRSVSKLPFVIALDQGLYEKYGLDVEIRLEPLDFDGGISLPSNSIWARILRKIQSITGRDVTWDPDIRISGGNGQIVRSVQSASMQHRVFLAATDCVVSEYIVGDKNMQRLEDLKGKRLGVSSMVGNSGYVAQLLAERMGWDPVQDISIMLNGNSIEVLRDGRVDAIVASDREHAAAMREGFSMLTDMSTWDEPLAGNSVHVSPEWLREPGNREIARRFLQATVEGIALFHTNRDLALFVLKKWHGVADPEYAKRIYEYGKWTPRKPYPCYAGIAKTMERYDSLEMRKYSPQDFYDDSLLRELDESGFIDAFY